MPDWSAYVRSRLSLPTLAREREAEIVEDLAAQLEEAYREAVRTGATEDEAIARAEQHIGDWRDLNRRLDRSTRDRQPVVERWNERADDRAMDRASGWSFVATVRQDLLHAWRVMRQSRSLIAIGVVSLALGIGANTAIFSVINGLLLRPLPVAHADALVSLTSPDMSGIMSGVQTGERGLLSYHEFENLRDRHDAFDGLLAFSSDVFVAPIATEANGEGASQAITLVSGTYFPTLGLAASNGRVFGTDVDAAPMANPIAVVSDDFWRTRMQADHQAIGRTIYIRRTAFTVVGVLPAAFKGLVVGAKPDVYVPLTMQQAVFPGMDLLAQTPGKTTRIMFLHVVGRLRPDATLQQATASVNAAFAQGLQAEGSAIADETRRRELLDAQLVLRFVPHGLSPLRSEYTTPLLVLMGLVGLVLLLACSNVASLLLARATGRRRELALRVALGANRARLIRQLLTESLCLATLGAAAGILVSRLGVTALLHLVSEDSSPVPLDAPVDATVLAFAAGLTVVTSLLFGLIPAIRATRVDLNDVFRGASSRLSGSGRGAGRFPIAKAIAAMQVALSLVLVVTAGLLVRSLENLTAVPVGYETRHLVTFEVDPSEAGYAQPAFAALYEDLTAKLAAVPGVKAVSLSSNGLFLGSDSGDEVTFPGETYPAGTNMGARFDAIGPNFFSTIGIPIIRGRDVESQDSVGMRSCWLGQRMQKQFFPGKDPVGRPMIIHYSFGDVPCEIRGVVADFRVNSQRGEQGMRFYTAYFGAASRPRAAVFALRVADRLDAVAAHVRQVVRGAGAFTPPSIHTVQELIERRLTSDRLTARLGAFFGVVALLLAAIGLYGLLAYSVGRRVGEIGLRMALGAGQGRILRLIVGEALIVTVVGAIVGLMVSLSSTGVLQTLLFNLSPRDPLTFVFGPAILLAVAIAAAAVPAWRASRTDPIVALRTE